MQTDFEAMGGTYSQAGDYLLPDVEVAARPQFGNISSKICLFFL